VFNVHFRYSVRQFRTVSVKSHSRLLSMGDWDTGLFHCTGQEHWKSFFVSAFCLCCQGAYQRAGLDQRECNAKDALLMLFCPICTLVHTRWKIREKYGISGSAPVDVMTLLCCTVCAVAQQTRQMDLRGAKPAGMWMDN